MLPEVLPLHKSSQTTSSFITGVIKNFSRKFARPHLKVHLHTNHNFTLPNTMSSDSDIVMSDNLVKNNSNKDNLLEGATQGIHPPKSTQETTSPKLPNISSSIQLTINMDQMNLLEENYDDETLAQTMGTKKEEITTDEINETNVMIVTYENQEQLEETMRKNPFLGTLQHKQTDASINAKNEWVKIRQWPVNADIEQVIILNDLLGWHGKVLSPKGNQKYTTAVLKAPRETEAKRLLEKGYIVNNGKLMAIVHQESTKAEEEKRTVLLVGINKTQEKLRREGSKLTEIGLLKSLANNGYPIQSLKFVYHDEQRYGHSAFVLLKKPIAVEELSPYQDATSGTIIKWAEVAEYEKICDKCLNWPEHLPTCSKHADNVRWNINSTQLAKRAAEGGSLIFKRLKRKPPSQPPQQQ
jgi:hypothetical protein